MFGFGKKRDEEPDPLAAIEEYEARIDADTDDSELDTLYSSLVRQGWYMAQNEHGEWIWHKEE